MPIPLSPNSAPLHTGFNTTSPYGLNEITIKEPHYIAPYNPLSIVSGIAADYECSRVSTLATGDMSLVANCIYIGKTHCLCEFAI